MCQVDPIHAINVENIAIKILLTTITAIACGTERPIAVRCQQCKARAEAREGRPTEESAGRLPIRYIERGDSPEAEIVDPSPRSSVRRKRDQVSIAPCIRLLVFGVIPFEADGLINRSQSLS